MPPTPLVSPEISAVANALHVRLDAVWPAIERGGRVVVPAQQLLTVIDTSSPAHGAGFSVPADALTCDTLRAAYNDTVTRFAAAA